MADSTGRHLDAAALVEAIEGTAESEREHWIRHLSECCASCWQVLRSGLPVRILIRLPEPDDPSPPPGPTAFSLCRLLAYHAPETPGRTRAEIVIGVPALAASYLALVALAVERRAWRRRARWLARVGHMALTLYLMHSFFFFGILYGVGPGLGLVGRIGPALGLAVAVAIFTFQVLASRWWLARYRFGPVEWLWRALTYGNRPALRRESTLRPPLPPRERVRVRVDSGAATSLFPSTGLRADRSRLARYAREPS